MVAPGSDLVVGVLPFLPSRRIDELYGPLVMSMADALDRPVRLRTASSFGSFSERLKGFDFDIAVVQPFEYVQLIELGYQPLVHVDQTLAASMVSLTPIDSSGFADLTEFSIGTPPSGSAMRLLVEAEFSAVGIDPEAVDMTAYSTHADCLQNLVLGDIEICATAPVPLREFENEFGQELTVVLRSRTIDSLAFVASPDLDSTSAAQIESFLLGLGDDEASLEILRLIGTTRLAPIGQGDYDDVRQLLAAANDR